MRKTQSLVLFSRVILVFLACPLRESLVTRLLASTMPPKKSSKPRKGVEGEISAIRRELRVLKPAIEMKMLDVTGTNSVSTTGFIQQLICPITQGTTLSTRVGDKIAVHGFDIRSIWFLPSVTPDYNNLGRFSVIEDRAAAGVSLTVSSVFTSVLAPVSAPFDSKYIVHHDQFALLSQNGPSNSFQHRVIKFKKPKVVQFSASSGSAADMAVRNFVVIGISDSTVATNPSHSFWIRVLYTDA